MFTTQLHLMFSHLPVIGTIIATLMMIYAMDKKNSKVYSISLWIFLISGGAMLIVYLTGEPAAELVRTIPGFNNETIERHEIFALASLAAQLILALLSAHFLLKEKNKLTINNSLKIILVVIAIVASVSIAWTGKLGGEIKHTEIVSQ